MRNVLSFFLAVIIITLLTATALANEAEVFYKPGESSAIGDITPFYDGEQFHIFFLNSNAKKWCVTETKDFVNYSDYKILQDFGGTGSVLYYDGWYHLYCAASANGKEVIRHFCSRDLLNWNMLRDTIASDNAIYVNYAWRDPLVFWNEETDCFWMLVTSNVHDKDTVIRDGCVALLTSSDLSTWQYQQPLYAPGRYEGSLECSDYFRMGDWYYLLYSCASENKRTYYVKSQSPTGPWIIPDTDALDSFQFYAGRTVSDGSNRYLLGWCGDRTRHTLDLGSAGEYISKDYATIGYGGNMVVHQLKQDASGNLLTSLPDKVACSFTGKLDITTSVLTGSWFSTSEGMSVSAPDRMASMLLSTDADNYLLQFTLSGNAKEIGFVLRTDKELLQKGYYYTLDRAYHRLTLKSGLRMQGRTGYYMPFETEAERPVAVADSHDITVMTEGDMTVVYIDQAVALTARHADLSARGIAFFCYGGNALFSNIIMKKYNTTATH